MTNQPKLSEMVGVVRKNPIQLAPRSRHQLPALRLVPKAYIKKGFRPEFEGYEQYVKHFFSNSDRSLKLFVVNLIRAYTVKKRECIFNCTIEEPHHTI